MGPFQSELVERAEECDIEIISFEDFEVRSHYSVLL